MALREEIRDYLMQINSLLIISAIPPKNELLSRVKTTLRFLEVRVPVINSERKDMNYETK